MIWTLKSRRRLGIVLAISIVMLAMFPSISNAQDCQWLPEDEGGDHYIMIDEDVYFYTTLDKSRKIRQELSDCEYIKEEINLLKEQKDNYKDILDTKGQMVSELETEVEFYQQLYEKKTEPDPLLTRVINNPRLNLITGVIVGASVVGVTFYILED